MKLETALIHAGQEPDPTTGAIMTPIFQTATFVQDGVGRHRGYEYSRSGNPTRAALEASLTALEGGQFGLAFASGLAATDTVLHLLASGDHLLAGNDVYGGTYRLFERVLRPYGLDFSYVDTTDLGQVKAGLRPNTRMIWLETPTNPLLNVSDISAIAEIGRNHSTRTLLVVDNTFATPYLQNPLGLGADLVVHSTTKYLGGHSDVVGGAVVGRDEALRERNDNTPASITERVQGVVDDLWTSSSAPTKTHQDACKFSSDLLTAELDKLRQLIGVDLAQLEKKMEAAGAPWTPGRLPTWP